MLFQASKVIWLLLLSVNLCSAMRGITTAPPDKNGVRIASASCKGKQYNEMIIQMAIRNKLLEVKQQGQNGQNGGDERLSIYKPGPSEKLPFNPPYFFTDLDNNNNENSLKDKVVFTRKGEMVKVVSPVQNERSAQGLKTKESRFEDCKQMPRFVFSPFMPIGYLQ
ncbi:hypothetical protein HI914_02281 [Erysiphe necator]|uniref:Csep0475 effector protein n=1 Tax=Uncinula necator TaxID=52586 RepID=A0A0B1P5D0_UNCNE|nr:hypothetical protein HI914_02281 [Erysiphe necator]KHJ33882.1 hypothetical protein EV44_g0481 [Erysiphe necator]